MSFDYFYGQQSDLFTFYRVPKVLFTNERFWNISADAKMLYGILLDRMSLSAKNGWIDKNGRVYIIFTIDEAKMALNCAEQKAIKLLSELEKKAGLIERKRQGLGKPNLIYVKNFISAVDSQLLNCENHNSGTMEITTQELPKSQCNNTDIKNTEFSDTDSIFPSGNGGMMDENDRYQEYFDYFSDQLSMDLLKKDYPYDSEMLDNILELIVETVCTKRPLIRIGAEERPAEIVRSRFMKLNAEHIRYVMDCFKENTTNGLMGVCDIIPKSSAKPGDLIFFQGTYDTSGASHVGIYVGNGMMIHCGNPISYASIESNYWQQHFYCFGRIRN